MKFIVKKLDIIKDSWWINQLSNKQGEIFFLCISIKDVGKLKPATIRRINRVTIKVKVDDAEYAVVAPISKKAIVKDGQVLKIENLFWNEVSSLSESPSKYIPIKEFLFDKPAWISNVIYIKQKTIRIL